MKKRGQISEAEHEVGVFTPTSSSEMSVEQKKRSQTQLSVESDLMTRQIQL